MRDAATITAAIQVLRRAGVVIRGGDHNAVEILQPKLRELRRLTWEPTSSAALINLRNSFQQDRPRITQTLYIIPVASQDDLVLTAAYRHQLNLVVLDPPQVILDGDSFDAGANDQNLVSNPGQRGKLTLGRWATERVLLLATKPLTQKEIAQDSGITQQAVSHAIRRTRDHGFISEVPQGYFVPRSKREALLDAWLANYSGPLGIETYWYGLQTPLAQGTSAQIYAEQMGVQVALSGDSAGDIYAPWRAPTVAIAYTKELLDFTAIDLVHASREDATMVAVVPRDHTIWATAASAGLSGLVDPIVALWDLTHAGGLDADQATAKLRKAILERTLG